MIEPGLDRHEWETEWQSLEPLVEDAPEEALPELHDLVARMMVARGYPIEDQVAIEGAEREVVAEFREARRLARVVDAGDNLDPGDVAAAVNAHRTLYESLLNASLS